MTRPLDYYRQLYPPQPTRFAMGVPNREASVLDALLTEDGEEIVSEDDGTALLLES
jgi:hypothetical protein